MKKLLVVTLMMAGATGLQAAPFVVSDVTAEAVTNYLCSVNSGADVSSAPEAVTGGVRLKFDLVGLAVGANTITCKAQNTLWGVTSASSSPPFFAIKPASLTAPRTLIIVP